MGDYFGCERVETVNGRTRTGVGFATSAYSSHFVFDFSLFLIFESQLAGRVLDPAVCTVESPRLHQASFVMKWEGQRRYK